MTAKQAILCVDDEAIILLSLVQELKNSFGDRFVYEKALDAHAAIALIDELTADGVNLILIISDWLMPGIKGDEFLGMVEKNHPAIKAILITGHADDEALKKVNTNKSVIAVLTKPWKAKELKNLITATFC